MDKTTTKNTTRLLLKQQRHFKRKKKEKILKKERSRGSSVICKIILIILYPKNDLKTVFYLKNSIVFFKNYLNNFNTQLNSPSLSNFVQNSTIFDNVFLSVCLCKKNLPTDHFSIIEWLE